MAKHMDRATIAAVAFLAAFVAKADFSIDIDLDGSPIRDVRQSTCGPIVGYAGCYMSGDNFKIPQDTYWFEEHADETSRAMREAGAWFQRMWSANAWFARRVPDTNPDPKKRYSPSNPDAAFKFWKSNGIKLLFTLEAWGGEKSKQEILTFVKWIVDNDYKDVVAGFELGNESFYSDKYPSLAPIWTEIVLEIKKMWPDVKIGICISELYENNPDLAQVRNRMLAEGKIERTTYFSASDHNRYSAQFIVAMSNCIDKISHVIYHAYGGETPYSCSYYGFQRFRNFCSAFPELKGKKFWLTEVRLRSDEDNRCQRLFRESLCMAHYALTAICQPDCDGFNHHQIFAQAGGIYQSNGKAWLVQWRDEGPDYPDFRAPMGRPRLDIGSCGVMYRILAEGIKTHPLVLQHGTSEEVGTEDTFFTSARVMDQVYARRRALKEGKSGWSVPKVDGEVEWVALTDARKNDLCFLMVNTKSTEQKVSIRAAGRWLAAPTYVTLSCPERFLDCREVPGDGKFWRQVSWEDTQMGYGVIPMARNEGLEPKSDAIEIEIAPHTVQSVTVMTRKPPKKKLP